MAWLSALFRRWGAAAKPAAGAADRPEGEPDRREAAAAATAEPRPPAQGPAPGQPDPAAAGAARHPFQSDPDRRFTALLLGVGSLRRAEAGPAERSIIDRIEQLMRGAHDADLVPRLPVVLPRLIGLVRRDDVPPRELAERLSHDPALVGEVVRLANSPRYRTGRDLGDLQEAVITLGQRGLIQLVTNAVMRPIFDTRQGRFSRSAGTRLWDLSERCSLACDALAGASPDRFHAYLAGMVANIGMIPVLRLLDDGYRDPQAPDSEAFHDALSEAVAALSGYIARQWDFHPEVCRAVAGRAADPATEQDGLSRALRAADRISKWHLLEPGLGGAALAGLDDAERRCYLELQRSYGG